MPCPKLIARPATVPCFQSELIARVRRLQTGNEQHGFHRAIEAVYRLARSRDLKAQEIAAKIAIAIYAGKIERHGLLSFIDAELATGAGPFCSPVQTLIFYWRRPSFSNREITDL